MWFASSNNAESYNTHALVYCNDIYNQLVKIKVLTISIRQCDATAAKMSGFSIQFHCYPLVGLSIVGSNENKGQVTSGDAAHPRWDVLKPHVMVKNRMQCSAMLCDAFSNRLEIWLPILEYRSYLFFSLMIGF